MSSEKYVAAARDVVENVAHYYDTLRDQGSIAEYKPYGEDAPNFLQSEDLVPAEAPQKGESWESVRDDIERVVFKNVIYNYSFCWFGTD